MNITNPFTVRIKGVTDGNERKPEGGNWANVK
jgi:hypothetical protein